MKPGLRRSIEPILTVFRLYDSRELNMRSVVRLDHGVLEEV